MMSHRWASILLVLAALGAARGADAANVLVFNSTRFVDSQQGAAYPVGSQESDNVQAALQALGHTVTTIAGPDDPVGSCSFGYSQPGTVLATAMQYQSALASADVFLIPEQESWCYLPGELLDHSDIVAVWRNWVAGGGGLVIHSSNEAKTKVADLFDVVFGLRGIGGVNGIGVTTTKRAAAQGTLFASGPATLAGNESTGAIPPATLPPGALSIYDDGTNASVVIIPFGAGKIVFLGWDWTKSDPPFTGDGQIGGWYPLVLDGAVREAASMVLTVAMTGTGAGTVTSSTPAFDAPIGCRPTCRAHYRRGAEVRLTATPTSDSIFRGWSGGGCTGTGPCALTLTADTVLTATFDPAAGSTFSLRVVPSGSGSGTVTSAPGGIACGSDCVESYPSGTAVTLAATAGPGAVFTGWSGGSCTGTGACALTLTADTVVTAAFDPTPPDTFALQVVPSGSGSGTVTSAPGGIACGSDCVESYPGGTAVTLAGTAAPGSVFGGWSGGGCSGTDACVITLIADTTLTATFQPQPGSAGALTVNKAGSGTGMVGSSPSGIDCGGDCSEVFPSGSTVTLTATPAPGSFFAGWGGAGCTGNGTCLLAMGANATVTAAFEAVPATLVTVAVNRPQFSAGDTLVVSVGLSNPGLPLVVDLYLGLLLPDGDTIVFFTGDGSVVVFGRASSPATFRPIGVGVTLASPFVVDVSDLFAHTWTGGEPRGRYLFFVAALAAGCLADGSVDAGELLAFGVAPFTFGGAAR